jgi:hypothetical protein
MEAKNKYNLDMCGNARILDDAFSSPKKAAQGSNSTDSSKDNRI